LARQVRVLSFTRERDYDQFMDEWIDSNTPVPSLDLGDSDNPTANLIPARISIRRSVRMKRSSGVVEWEPMGYLCTATASASSNPSDKIFAIHGVMKELGVLLPEPDYSMDTGEVYWRLVLH
jgi:hypothetical protein